MNLSGILARLGSFLIMGTLHPVVAKVGYHFGKGAWPAFLLAGDLCNTVSLLVWQQVPSIQLAVMGFSLFWSIHELYQQEKRVQRGGRKSRQAEAACDKQAAERKLTMKQLILSSLMALLLLMSTAACSGSSGQSAVGISESSAAGDVELPDQHATQANSTLEEEDVMRPDMAPSSDSQTDDEVEISDVAAQPEEDSAENAGSLRIRLTFEGNTISVQLYDTPAGRDLLSRLPMSLEFEDYAGVEKISYLFEPLATGEPSGTQPAGDFSYYAPWGNLAIFYNDPAPAANGLVVMGSIESGKEHLASMTEDFTMTIELDD